MNVLDTYKLHYETPKQPHKSIYSTLANRRANKRTNTNNAINKGRASLGSGAVKEKS